MSRKLYRIRDWDTHFENSGSRQLKGTPRWVAVPNKHDGEGYLLLVVAHDAGPAHFGAWNVILQVASKCVPRGTLIRDNGTPHTALTISIKTSFPKEIIAAALDRLVSEDISWMEELDFDTWASKHLKGHKETPVSEPKQERAKRPNRPRQSGGKS